MAATLVVRHLASVVLAGFVLLALNVSATRSASATLPPPNDNFANAVVITGQNGQIQGTNVGATSEPGEPQHGYGYGHSVWYRWTAPSTGLATLDITQRNFDAVFSVYTGASFPDFNPVVNGVDFNEPRASFGVVAGTTYQIAVDGYASTGTFTLAWSMYFGPPNDVIVAAVELTGPSGSVTGTNRGATKEYGEPRHHPSGWCERCGGASVWWKWTAPSVGRMRIGAGGTDFPHLFAVYTRRGTYMYRVNDELEVSNEFQEFTAWPGETYLITVDRDLDWNGNVELTWSFTPAPANDNFAESETLSGPEGSVTGTTYGASVELDEPEHAYWGDRYSVWYTWTPSEDQTVLFDTPTGAGHPYLAVYVGSDLESLEEVAEDVSPPGGSRFKAHAGQN
jgi:hypothetical protein